MPGIRAIDREIDVVESSGGRGATGHDADYDDNDATGPRLDPTTTCLRGGSHAKCPRHVSRATRGR